MWTSKKKLISYKKFIKMFYFKSYDLFYFENFILATYNLLLYIIKANPFRHKRHQIIN